MFANHPYRTDASRTDASRTDGSRTDTSCADTSRSAASHSVGAVGLPRPRPHVAYIAGLCVVLLTLAATTPARSASGWSRTYGGSATFEQPLALHELPDHTILIGGVTDSWGTGTGDALRVRIDAEGFVLGQRVFGNALPGGASDIAFDADGGMAVVGAHTLDLFSDRDAWIHHVDAGGAIDWERSFDFDPGMHAFYAVEATSDGGYIATGSTANDVGVPIWAWVVKFDSAGNVSWQHRYNGGVAEHANFVVETTDGGYAIAGWTTSSGAGLTDIWLLKTSSTGAIQWQKTYGGSNQEEATGLIQTSDGGFALSAFTDTYPASGHGAWVLRLDTDGDVLWHAVMDEWGDFRDIMQTADGNLLATGRIAGPTSNDLWVVKFRDTDGDVLWQRAYKGTEGDWGSRTIELSDGDLLIGGVWAFGFAGEDIWIQRTNSFGAIPSCDLISETSAFPRSPVITVRPAGAAISVPEPLPEAISFVSNAATVSVDEKCRTPALVEDRDPLRSPAEGFTIHPNPIRDAGVVAFRLENAGRIRLDLLDVNGRRVATLTDRVFATGEHHVAWEGPGQSGLPAGVYFLALSSEHGSAMRRAVVVR